MCRIHETRTTAPTEQQPRSGNEMIELALTRLRTTRFGRRSSGTGRNVRRIADDQIGASAIRLRRKHHVVFDQTRFFGDAIFIEISRAELRRLVVDLDERHVRRSTGAKQRDAYCARARAEIERRARDFFRPRKAREMERVDVGAIASATRRLKRESQKKPYFCEGRRPRNESAVTAPA